MVQKRGMGGKGSMCGWGGGKLTEPVAFPCINQAQVHIKPSWVDQGKSFNLMHLHAPYFSMFSIFLAVHKLVCQEVKAPVWHTIGNMATKELKEKAVSRGAWKKPRLIILCYII